MYRHNVQYSMYMFLYSTAQSIHLQRVMVLGMQYSMSAPIPDGPSLCRDVQQGTLDNTSPQDMSITVGTLL